MGVEIEDLMRQGLKSVQDKMISLINEPLKSGMIDEKEHDQFKLDLNEYAKLLSEGRNVEAESYKTKLIEKYGKLNGIQV